MMAKKQKLFVIACGGTGGHLFPGIAVSEVLYDRGYEVLLLVSEKEIDSMILSTYSEFRKEVIPSIGLPSILSPAFIGFLKRSYSAWRICRELYKQYMPVAILGMGGFTSAIPLIVGRFTGIPCALHESNAIAGKANKLASRWTNHIMIGFKCSSVDFENHDCFVTGTPIRNQLKKSVSREDAYQFFSFDPSLPTVLVMGGSQGASGINQIMFRVLNFLKNIPLQIIHLTGEKDENLAIVNYQRESIKAYVSSFCREMINAYTVADLVISRAGASSLSEFSFFSLPSILIPFPFSADQHQYFNAEVFRDAGASELLEERNIDPENFAILLKNLLSDKRRLSRMSSASGSLLPIGSAEQIADILEKIQKKSIHINKYKK